MNIAIDMRGGNILRQHIIVGKIFAALRAVFEHGAHGGVGINVGVFTLKIGILGIRVGQVLVNPHQVPLRLADLGVIVPVKNIGLGGPPVAGGNQLLLHNILNRLHIGHAVPLKGQRHTAGQLRQGGIVHRLLFHGVVCLFHRIFDF